MKRQYFKIKCNGEEIKTTFTWNSANAAIYEHVKTVAKKEGCIYHLTDSLSNRVDVISGFFDGSRTWESVSGPRMFYTIEKQ